MPTWQFRCAWQANKQVRIEIKFWIEEKRSNEHHRQQHRTTILHELFSSLFSFLVCVSAENCVFGDVNVRELRIFHHSFKFVNTRAKQEQSFAERLNRATEQYYWKEKARFRDKRIRVWIVCLGTHLIVVVVIDKHLRTICDEHLVGVGLMNSY